MVSDPLLLIFRQFFDMRIMTVVETHILYTKNTAEMDPET